MGREQWFLTPKDGISLLGIRSKIERQGVRREKRKFLSFFVSYMRKLLARVLRTSIHGPGYEERTGSEVGGQS
jgi:hypothetical protein